MRDFALWLNDRDIMNLWGLQLRHSYPCKKVSTNIDNIILKNVFLEGICNRNHVRQVLIDMSGNPCIIQTRAEPENKKTYTLYLTNPSDM